MGCYEYWTVSAAVSAPAVTTPPAYATGAGGTGTFGVTNLTSLTFGGTKGAGTYAATVAASPPTSRCAPAHRRFTSTIAPTP